MKALLILSLFFSNMPLVLAAEHGDACPDGINQVERFYLDHDAKCRAIILYCRDGVLQQLELPNPPVDAGFCRVNK